MPWWTWICRYLFKFLLFHFIFPPTMHKGSYFSTSFPKLLFSVQLIVAVLMSVNCYWIVVLICISLMIWDVGPHFICLLTLFFWRIVYSSSLPVFHIKLFILLLFCRSSLYVLHINFLSDRWFEKTFCLSVVCLPFHSSVSLDAQKLLSLM